MAQSDLIRTIDDRIRLMQRQQAKGTVSAVAGGGYATTGTSGGVPIHGHDSAAHSGLTTGNHHAEVHAAAGADHTFPGDASLYLDGSGAFSSPNGQLLANPILDDAAIKGLGTAAFELIPTPGSGKMIATDIVNFGSSLIVKSSCLTDYSGIDVGPLRIGYDVDPSLSSYVDIDSPSALQPNATFTTPIVVLTAPFFSAGGGSGWLTRYANQPLTLSLPSQVSGDLTGGDASNTLTLWIWYRIVTL
jgi:hypothetical protein